MENYAARWHYLGEFVGAEVERLEARQFLEGPRRQRGQAQATGHPQRLQRVGHVVESVVFDLPDAVVADVQRLQTGHVTEGPRTDRSQAVLGQSHRLDTTTETCPFCG